MTGKDMISLPKVIKYANDALEYTKDMTFESFMLDNKTISACAFILSQIGEISKNISPETQERYKDVPWISIRGLRNRIVHDYDNVNFAVLWRTIKLSLPQLIDQLKEILHEQAEEKLADLEPEEDEDETEI